MGVIPEVTLAHRLRIAREYAGLEQGELAEVMGVARGTVGMNERGEVKPRLITIKAWALATGVSVDWLETGIAPAGDPGQGDFGAVRRQGLEPRTRWFGARHLESVAA